VTTKKVRLAIYDKDLKARTYKKFDLTNDGAKIRVKTGGKGNFNPEIDNDSFVELPKRAFLRPWITNWQRIYFVPNWGKKCVNFQTSKVLDPDPDSVRKAASTTMLNNLGKEKAETSLLTYIMLGLLIFIALKLLGVIA
jgi:hypothetical protein